MNGKKKRKYCWRRNEGRGIEPDRGQPSPQWALSAKVKRHSGCPEQQKRSAGDIIEKSATWADVICRRGECHTCLDFTVNFGHVAHIHWTELLQLPDSYACLSPGSDLLSLIRCRILPQRTEHTLGSHPFQCIIPVRSARSSLRHLSTSISVTHSCPSINRSAELQP